MTVNIRTQLRRGIAPSAISAIDECRSYFRALTVNASLCVDASQFLEFLSTQKCLLDGPRSPLRRLIICMRHQVRIAQHSCEQRQPGVCAIRGEHHTSLTHCILQSVLSTCNLQSFRWT
jgi:hypothetical protein